MPSLSRLDERRCGQTLVRLLALFLTLTVAALTLFAQEWDHLKIDLGDPVEKYLPRLSNRQVMIGGTPDQPKLEVASHLFTIRELITHTAGFTYGGGTDAVGELWKRANIWQAKSLSEFVYAAVRRITG